MFKEEGNAFNTFDTLGLCDVTSCGEDIFITDPSLLMSNRADSDISYYLY